MTSLVKAGFNHFIKYPEQTKFEGEDAKEQIVLLMRKHLVTNTPWVAIAFVMLFVPKLVFEILAFSKIDVSTILPYNFRLIIIIFWYMITLTYVFQSYLIWYFNVYIVTNKRIVDVDFYAILNRKISETPIQQVQDVTLSVAGIFPSMFDYGDIQIQTAAEQEEFEFEAVPNPSFVHDKISDLATEAKQRARTK